MQQVFFDVFALLYAHGKVSAKALALPVSYWRTGDNVRNVAKMLLCFSNVACHEEQPRLEEDLSEYWAPPQGKRE